MPFAKLTRRHLLIAAGGGTVVAGAGGLWFMAWKAGQRRWAKAVDRKAAFAPSVFVSIGEDDQVTIWLTKAEMGQGVMTSLPMLVAEELDADWSKVSVVQAVVDGKYDYGKTLTVASSSVASLWLELRKAGAAAREMLLATAADRWAVSESECRTEMGVVRRRGSEETLSYGQLAVDAAKRTAPFDPKLKSMSEFRLLGKPVERVDLEPKVTGAAKFGLDVRQSDMLRVALVRCPVMGGTLQSVDPKPALEVEGVQRVLELREAVAVVARDTDVAFAGARALKPVWQQPQAPSSSDVAENLRQAVAKEGLLAAGGDTDHADEDVTAERIVEATYELPFLAHATMEPPNCTVHLQADSCELWSATQNPEEARAVTAQITGLPLERVTLNRPYLGGGFGRRAKTDEVAEAVSVAKLLGQPLQLVWTREDDVRHDFYREASAHALRAELNSDGAPVRWRHRIATAEGAQATAPGTALMGATDLPYRVGTMRVEWAGVGSPVNTGIWRSVGHSYNTFAIESFIDEIAAAAELDPLELRLHLLPDNDRLGRCVAAVKEFSSWPNAAPLAALGAAACAGFGSYVALVTEVFEGEFNEPRVRRVWCVVDCGFVLNPDTVQAQVEGGIIFALSAALHGEITVDRGAVAQSNFDDYPLLRQREVPQIEVRILPSNDPPGGVGELSVPPVAPAVCNAWFRLTGKRQRKLPLKKER